MTYSVEESCAAAGVAKAKFNADLYRGIIIPENGPVGPGRGRALRLSRLDALQTAFIAAAGNAGMPLKRAALLWRVVSSQHDLSDFSVYVMEKSDASDTIFKMAPASAPRPADVAPGATKIDVGQLQRQVNRRLDNVDAERICSNPTAYSFRIPYVASHNPGAPWTIILQSEEGEPDAEAIARICDAIEARDHLLLCGASKAALACLVTVVDRAMRANATT